MINQVLAITLYFQNMEYLVDYGFSNRPNDLTIWGFNLEIFLTEPDYVRLPRFSEDKLKVMSGLQLLPHGYDDRVEHSSLD